MPISNSILNFRSNNSLSDKYHPCQWSAGRWICCGDSSRNAPGCEPITWTPRQSKSDPVPPLPASVIVAAEAVAAAAARNEVNNEVLNAITSTGGIISNPNVTGGKIVIALYPFTAIEPGDLTLVKGDEYEVLDDSQDHWWQVRNKMGEEGFIPSNYVKEKDGLGLQTYDW